jgi:hypothetical protein
MSYEEYRQDCMEKGVEYQDFICEQLHIRGIVLQNMSSRKYQYRQENLLGLEIKRDDIMSKTGRIYIETAEKARPRAGDYVKAGIYRDDKSWMYGIGNDDIFYIFDKKGLQRLDLADPSWLFRPNPTPTSKGFCIPLEKAELLAMRIISFAENKD